MGVWGSGLYQSDFALDLKHEIETLMTLPLEGREIERALLEDHPEACDADHEHHSDFWLVLRDRFHAFQIVSEDVVNRVAFILESGLDLQMWRELDGDTTAIRARQKALERLAAKWSTPPKRPRRRKRIKQLPAFCMAAGDVFALPVHGARPTGEAPGPEGWGAFIVLRHFRRYRVVPRYIVAQLQVFEPETPALEDCLAAQIDHVCRPAILPRPEGDLSGAPIWSLDFLRAMERRGLPANEDTALAWAQEQHRGMKALLYADASEAEYREAMGEPSLADAQVRACLIVILGTEFTPEWLAENKARHLGCVELAEERLRQDLPFIFDPPVRELKMGREFFCFRKEGEDFYGRIPGVNCPIGRYIA